jgi:hypothetical protein
MGSMSSKTDLRLKKEVEKWLDKIEKEIKNVRVLDKTRSGFLKNIKAYVKDCKYFLGKGDLIRAFEAVIWGWANLELGLQFGILEQVSTINHGNHAE